MDKSLLNLDSNSDLKVFLILNRRAGNDRAGSATGKEFQSRGKLLKNNCRFKVDLSCFLTFDVLVLI